MYNIHHSPNNMIKYIKKILEKVSSSKDGVSFILTQVKLLQNFVNMQI